MFAGSLPRLKFFVAADFLLSLHNKLVQAVDIDMFTESWERKLY